MCIRDRCQAGSDCTEQGGHEPCSVGKCIGRCHVRQRRSRQDQHQMCIRDRPQEEWYRVENTHEAIISEEVFQKVQELIASRRRKRRNGTTQIFAGLIKCADCGWSLAYGENKQNKNPYGYYHCSKNGQGLRQCSMHYIRYDVLYAYVLARLQYWSMMIQKDEDKLLKRLLNASDREKMCIRDSLSPCQSSWLRYGIPRSGCSFYP